MLETLPIEDDGKIAVPDAVQTRYGFKPNTSVRLIETKNGVLLLPLSNAPMSAEVEEWQALSAAEATNGNTAVPIPHVLATNLPIKDRSCEDEWLHAHQGEYAGQYGALQGNRLVAHRNSFAATATAAHATGVQDALVVLRKSPAPAACSVPSAIGTTTPSVTMKKPRPRPTRLIVTSPSLKHLRTKLFRT